MLPTTMTPFATVAGAFPFALSLESPSIYRNSKPGRDSKDYIVLIFSQFQMNFATWFYPGAESLQVANMRAIMNTWILNPWAIWFQFLLPGDNSASSLAHFYPLFLFLTHVRAQELSTLRRRRWAFCNRFVIVITSFYEKFIRLLTSFNIFNGPVP